MKPPTGSAVNPTPSKSRQGVSDKHGKRTHVFCLVLVAATWCLLFVGAMVTSTNSGLAVPDWPTTYGQNMFLYPVSQWKGGILFEHGHRLFASMVGLLALVNALLFGGRHSQQLIRRLSYLALLLVIAQGLLGGLTVRMKLPMLVSSAHGGLAQMFFLCTVALAVLTSPAWLKASTFGAFSWLKPGVRPALAFLGLVYVQILIGAIMRHSFAGLAIPTYPKAFGGWIPSFWSFGIFVNFLHTRIFPAVLLLVLFLVMRSVWVSAHAGIRRTARLLVFAFAVQVFLGMSVIWLHKAPIPTSIHVAVAAWVTGGSLILMLWSGKCGASKSPAPQAEPMAVANSWKGAAA